MKVLLVDDDVFVRRMLAKMIPWAELGFTQVLEAENGEVGVYLVEKEHPLLIVTDVRMPLLSGLELTAQARKLTLDTYVIVLSAYNDFEYVRTAVTERVTDYFVKPLSRERLNELIARIRQIVQEHQEKQRFHDLLSDRSAMLRQMKAILCREEREDILFQHEGDRCALPEYRGYCALVLDTLRTCLKEQGASDGQLEEMQQKNAAFLRECNDLYALREYTMGQVRACAQASPSSQSAYARFIEQYVSEHYAEPDLSVASIAEVMHMSPVYIGAVYKQARGVSLTTCINTVRMEKSRELLCDLSLSIAEVSRLVGYASAEYYARLFHKRWGMTPSEYRAHRRPVPQEDRP